MTGTHHRYRRPRLLTPSKKRAKFENPRWRSTVQKNARIIKKNHVFCIFCRFTASDPVQPPN